MKIRVSVEIDPFETNAPALYEAIRGAGVEAGAIKISPCRAAPKAKAKVTGKKKGGTLSDDTPSS